MNSSPARIKISLSFVLILLFISAGLALRWMNLSAESFWFDEGYTAWITGCSPSEILRNVTVDISAPLHFILLHYWRGLFGDGDATLRSFSALCSTAAIGIFWILAQRTLRRPWAVAWAMALLCLSTMQVEHAREARYYALLSLLCVLMLEGMDRFLRRRSRWAFAQFVLASAAALYCHNIAAFYLVAIQVAWLLWPTFDVRCSRRWFAQRTLPLLLADLLILALYTPWIPSLLKQLAWMRDGNFWDTTPDVPELLWTVAVLAGVKGWYPGRAVTWMRNGSWEGSTEIATAVIVLIIFTILALILWRSRRQHRRMALALAVFALLPVASLFVQSLFRQPSFVDRTFIMSSPALCLMLAIPLREVRRQKTEVRSIPILSSVFCLLTSVLLISSIFSIHGLLTEEHKEDWRGVVQYITALPDERRLLIFLGNEGQLPFDHYAARASRRPYDVTGAPQGFFDLNPPQAIRRVRNDDDLLPLKNRLQTGLYSEIVLILRNEQYYDPQSRVQALLDANSLIVQRGVFQGLSIRRYTPRPGSFVYCEERPFAKDLRNERR